MTWRWAGGGGSGTGGRSSDGELARCGRDWPGRNGSDYRLSRPTGAPDTNVTHYNSGANFGRLSQIRVGSTAGVYPDYNYTYSYNELGNLMSRTGTDPDMTYTYGAGNAGPQAVTSVAQNGDDDLAFAYGVRGNMATRSQGGSTTHNYAFDVEGRLTSVTMGTQATTFAYDADGQRVLAVYDSGTTQETRVYTPFPDYEMEDPPAGDNITRTTYRLAGQMVAVQKRVGTGAGTFAYTYTDHLGNLVGLSSTAGVLDPTSLARYDPFGNFRTTPTTNPGTTNHGFTGHRHNNTGTNNLGLIYMNARYYLPEVGRFVSPDTIVPQPGEPQSYNRYSYVRNSPLISFDPSGHREIGINENDLLPYQPPAPTLAQLTPIEPVFIGLPIEGVEWVNGYGPNFFAYDNPEVYSAQSAGIHPGMDFGKAYDPSCPSCMLVYANVSGTVSDKWGNDADPNVVIELDNGMFVVYGHVIIDSHLAVGTRVEVKDVIGMLQDQRNDQYDNTHVHLSLREGTRTYNPAYFFADPAVLDSFAWNYPSPESLYKVSSYRYTSGKSYWNVEDRQHIGLAEW